MTDPNAHRARRLERDHVVAAVNDSIRRIQAAESGTQSLASGRERLCDACGRETATAVASLPGVPGLPGAPISVAYGKACLAANAHPWELLAVNTALSGGLDRCRPWWQDMVSATCRHLNRDPEEFTAAVEAIMTRWNNEQSATGDRQKPATPADDMQHLFEKSSFGSPPAPKSARVVIEVLASVIPERPEPVFTRRFAITTDEWENAGPEEKVAMLTDLNRKAQDYAASLMVRPDRVNWVRTDWLYL